MGGPGGWEREVASVAFLSTEGLVLVDPLIEHSWTDLDGLVDDHPVTVLLTAPWHERSTSKVVARYGAEVFAHQAGLARLSHSSAQAITEGEFMQGIEVFPVAGSDDGEVVLWLPSEATLIAADVLTGTPGGLRVTESPELRSRIELRSWLGRLAELPLVRVLPAHGPPVLHDGRDQLVAALHRPPW